MTRENVSVTSLLEDTAQRVREVVNSYRGRGSKIDEAHEQAAADLGLTAGRVRRFMYGEVYALLEGEGDRVRAGHREWMVSEAHRLRARADMLHRRLLGGS